MTSRKNKSRVVKSVTTECNYSEKSVENDSKNLLNIKRSASQKQEPSFNKLNIYSAIVATLAISIIFFVGFDECKRCFHEIRSREIAEERCTQLRGDNMKTSHPETRKTYWIYNRKPSDSHLKHVHRVLQSLGYERSISHTLDHDWDLLWAHDYPFIKHYDQLNNLAAHQRVNHLPGCGYITTKVELSTSDLKYNLPAFKLPEDKDKFANFTARFPHKQFVLKDNEHRDIRIQNVDAIPLNANGSFAQVFMDDPLLISGYMFDIGIYTIITSIQPLRIYMYNGDILLRFCPEPYKPFDVANLDKYVVGDDYLPIWQVPKIQYWYKTLGFSMRDSLTAYLHDEGRDARPIWRQIEEAIAIAVKDKQSKIADVLRRFPSKRNFFEMMRFDFLVDNALRVYLLEANMSPNLSSAHFKPNQLLYEQVLFNVFGLVGLADRAQTAPSFRNKSDFEMETSEKNLLVMPNICASALCRDNCDEIDCKLCKRCLDDDRELLQDLQDAHREHLNRGDCKRIYPPSMVPFQKLPQHAMINTNVNDQLMYLWFQEKCNLDSTWC